MTTPRLLLGLHRANHTSTSRHLLATTLTKRLNSRYMTTMAGAANEKPHLNRRLPMACGHSIPQLGFGVYQTPADQTTSIVSKALEAGFRHIDSAAAYRNEYECALALCRSGIPRDQLFYTTKLPPRITGYEATVTAIKDSLAAANLQRPGSYTSSSSTASTNIKTITKKDGDEEGGEEKGEELKGLGYIDLYLIHAPTGDPESRAGSWKAMLESQQRGEIKSLGVSNYGIPHLRELTSVISSLGGVISVWQGEIHPYLSRHDIREWCKQHNVVIQAYCPLIRATRMDDPLLKSIAEKYGKTVAQVLIRWSLQMGFVPLPKTVKEERVMENVDVFGEGFELTEEECKRLDTGEYMPCSWDPTVWGLSESRPK